MAGDAESSRTEGEGVRRRRSGQEDDEDVTDTQRDSVRTGTHALETQSPRVHFSEDTERRPSLHQAKKRKSDEMLQDRDGSNERRAAPGSSTATRAAAVMSGDSVPSAPAKDAYASSPGTQHRSTPAASRSSTRSRNRDLSLRSGLFTRDFDRRAIHDESVVEMQPVVHSASAFGGSQTAKKGPSVKVSPVVESEPSSSSLPSSSPCKDMPRTTALPDYQQWVQRQADRHLPLKRIKEAYQRGRKFVLRIQEIPPSKDGRHVLLDPSRRQPLIDERTGRPHVDNTSKSSKYNVWNFLPRQLVAQFSKLANSYFLTVSILQMIPGLSTTGTYTTIVPLLFFVSISMAKEGYEDLRRHRLDKSENNGEARVLHAYREVPAADEAKSKDGLLHWASAKWHSLQVGDVVKLERDEPAPADLVLLRSTGSNNLAYVETMALDGETNLKPKQPPAVLVSALTSEEAVAAGRAEFVVEDPNLDLYNFEGRVTIEGQTAPLTNNEIVYRGSVLRNTPEIIGMVVYSGEECKIRMNANKNPRIKAPSLQATVNKIVIIIVCFVIFLALFNTVAYQVWHGATEDKAWYLTHARVPLGHVLVSFIIMFNTMIPLSLYVSMEIIKVAQMVLLNLDVDMYDEQSNTPLEARTSTINEELGQVGYVFSDKTGTLTENVMQFRKLSVAGTVWLHEADLERKPEDEDILVHKKRMPKGKGKQPQHRISRKSTSYEHSHPHARNLNGIAGSAQTSGHDPQRNSISQWTSPAASSNRQHELPTTDMIRYIQRRPNTVFAKKARLMILSMALCHTCLPERDGDDSVSYQASSPDELALVQAASELGYVAYDRDLNTLVLRTFPNGQHAEAEYESFQVLDIIEFSSNRKRMSLVVRFPDGRVCVLCKGADSAVMQRLRLAGLAHQKLAEVEKRINQRRSMEAEQVLRRKSARVERKSSVGSFPRASIQLSRPSMARPSIDRLELIRDEVDGWLSERERDVMAPRVSDIHYSPRPSAQIGRASSPNTGVDVDELVEDTLAMDEAVVIERCFQHINDFATDGLRTLLYGYRFLDEDEYLGWKKVYHDATTSLVDRQRRIEDAGEMIEQQLELGGATAIEDKLQRGVPETIDRLRRANIKLWMLTGDKRETAINIGHSCRLIKDYSSVTVLDHEAGNIEQKIAATILEIGGGGIAHAVVVVDGQTLGFIENEPSLHALFLYLAILVDTVICCRASPSQKASLVHAIRRRVKRSVTLAIGDGANDIAMIQEAHVGIGITGKEGLQAAGVSDYSIAQFRFLTKLLLVHGRWNYIRTCKLFYLTQALYQRSAGYTGTSLYESWSLSMFNTLFTSLVVIFLGIFEQDLHASTLIAVPELYTKGQRSAAFNFGVYLGWMFMAASEAIIVFYCMLGLYGKTDFTLDQNLYPLGDMTFTACVIIIAIKLQVIEQRCRTYMAAIGLVLAIGGWLLWNIILAATYHSSTNPEYYVKGSFFHTFGRNALWWLSLLLTVTACLGYEVAIRSLKHAFFPTDVETFQTLEGDLGSRKRFEEASALWLQAGWHHGSKKSSMELEHDAEAQTKREGEIQELLDRPRVMEEGGTKGGVEMEERVVVIDDGDARPSLDTQELLSRRFGNVRRESLAQP